VAPGQLVRPVGHQEQHGERGQLAREGTQQVEAGRVSPVRVVEEQHQRLAGGQHREVVAHPREDRRLARRGVPRPSGTSRGERSYSTGSCSKSSTYGP
jgi:hypothetical protein